MRDRERIGNVSGPDIVERTKTEAADYTDPVQDIHGITKPAETRDE